MYFMLLLFMEKAEYRTEYAVTMSNISFLNLRHLRQNRTSDTLLKFRVTRNVT